ncbi:MAG: response regulator transcription factor, partial [Thermoanaerobaculia bacterium]|nr:response regulator transcription factor [Thermoanaerobaculia bacterium]
MSRILLVEDEAHLAEGLAFNLRNSGYDVAIAVSGEEALEAFARQPCDVILLDVMLPGIDGFEVARRLRKAGEMVPILIVSAHDRAADAIAGLDAGADDYITKPFDLDEVLAR